MARKSDKTEMVSINGEALKMAISEQGLTQAALSKKIGCGCAISNAIMRNVIPKPLLTVLKYEYGITQEKLEEYSSMNTRTQSVAEEIIIAPQISEEQWERFASTIKESIFEALNEWCANEQQN